MHMVILGGGLAGVTAAKEISKRTNQRIILVTRSKLFGGYKKYDDIFSSKKITVVHDTVLDIEPHGHQVICRTQNIPYDSLVIALGNDPKCPSLISEINRDCIVSTHHDIDRIEKKVINDAKTKNHLRLNYAVIGGGVTGVELAGRIGAALRKHQLKPRFTPQIFLVEKQHRLLPKFLKQLSDRADRRLARLGVTVLVNTYANNLRNDFLAIKNTKIPLENVFWSMGVEPNPLYRKHPSVFKTDENGEPILDSNLELYKDIFVISSISNNIYTINRKAKFLARHLTSKHSFSREYIPPQVIAFSVGDDWSYVEKAGVRTTGKVAKRLLDGYAKRLYKNTNL